MLDERTLALLDIINLECQNDGYKVILIDDILLSMPKYFNIDKQEFFECIKLLINHEYISVKYQDEQEICVCPLAKGRLEAENRLDKEIEKSQCEKKYFIYAFLGALTGSVINFVLMFILSMVGVL